MKKSKIAKATVAILLVMTVLFASAYTICGKVNDDGISVSDEYNNHDFVDLGLPSGTLWANCNVGANTPEGYGGYFAWGEIELKTTYDWNTYIYCKGNHTTLTKYCDRSTQGYNGFVDDITVLFSEDDAAVVNWGKEWQIPTTEQWQELQEYTTSKWTTFNGVNGRLFTAHNGKSLFLPAAGYCWDNTCDEIGETGHYWSNSLIIGHPFDAWCFDFSSHYCYLNSFGNDRYHGYTIRAVHSSK